MYYFNYVKPLITFFINFSSVKSSDAGWGSTEAFELVSFDVKVVIVRELFPRLDGSVGRNYDVL